MSTPRRFWVSLLVVAVGTFLVSGGFMIARVVEYNRTLLPERPYFHPVDRPSFEYAGRPVSFVHEPAENRIKNQAENRAENQADDVLVTFGERQLRIREQVPNDIDAVPDLRRYEEWLRVYRMIMVKGRSAAEAIEAVERDELDDRLIMVVVRSPAGSGGGWSRIWVDQYQFDIYEFTEAGEIEHERFRFPKERAPDEPVPDGELEEGTWQYDAAMSSLPPVYRPEPTRTQNASLALGWTFPLAGASLLVATAALIMILVGGSRSGETSPAGRP